MALSLASGAPFLGLLKVPRPVRVAVVSGESGKATLQETAHRIIKSRKIDEEKFLNVLQWCFDLPQFPDLANVTAFANTLKGLKSEVVIIDPVYLCVGGEIDHANMFPMGEMLKRVSDLLLKEGITPLLIHHANRQLKTGGPMELSHLAYSDLDQFARQFLLINRQSGYRGDGVHDLWLSASSSAGHGALWDLHIDEGVADDNINGRFWAVTLKDANAAKAEENWSARSGKDRSNPTANGRRGYKRVGCDRAITAGGFPPGTSKNKLRERAHIPDKRLKRILDRLAKEAIIEPVEYKQPTGKTATRKVTGYRRTVRSGHKK